MTDVPESKSALERAFSTLWRILASDIELKREHKFYPSRRWRADFAHPETRVLIEIEGGIWGRGRHVRGKGFENDCRKYNAATMAGWAVIRLTPRMVNEHETLETIAEFIRKRLQHAKR